MSNLPARKVTCAAPAKINLALHVTAQRADGYHELDTLVAFAEPADQLTLIVDENESGPPQLEISGPFGETLKAETGNLVLSACEAFLAEFNLPNTGQIRFQLAKNLPVSSGIGGGSADAAATLLCLARWFNKDADDRLARIANGLGADVPMCLHSAPLIAKGTGDVIEPLDDFPPLHMVLANPGRPVSTPQIFRSLSQRNNPALAPLPADLSQASLIDWLHEQRNDMQAAAIALVPEIAETLDTLKASGATLARMCGSGATCFGLYESEGAAQTAAETIANAHPGWWVQATATRPFGLDRARTI